MVEDAISCRRPCHDRSRVVRKSLFDNQRWRVRVRGGRGNDTPRLQRFVERAVERQLDRNVPISRTARARVSALVVGVNAQRINPASHSQPIVALGEAGATLAEYPRTIICNPLAHESHQPALLCIDWYRGWSSDQRP